MGEDAAHIVGDLAHDETVEQGHLPPRPGAGNDAAGRPPAFAGSLQAGGCPVLGDANSKFLLCSYYPGGQVPGRKNFSGPTASAASTPLGAPTSPNRGL